MIAVLTIHFETAAAGIEPAIAQGQRLRQVVMQRMAAGYPLGFSRLLSAYDLYFGPVWEVAIVGALDSPEVTAFRHYLRLHRPIYQKTAAYGHFGREDHDFTWERTDKAETLRAAAGLGGVPVEA